MGDRGLASNVPAASDHADQVLTLFDGKAAGWPGKYAAGGRLAGRLTQFTEAVLDLTAADGQLLDLGCGSGELARHLAAVGYRVTGCDIAVRMLRQAAAADREHAIRWIMLEPRWRTLPFTAESLDAVVAASVLEYVRDPAAVLAECARVLRPGGVLLCTLPNVADPVRWLEWPLGLVARTPLAWIAQIGPQRLGQYLAYLRTSRQRHRVRWWHGAGRRAGLEPVPTRQASRGPLRLLAFAKPRGAAGAPLNSHDGPMEDLHMKPTVLVLQEQVPHYRVPFFRFLAEELGSRDLDLRVVSSSALPEINELGFQHHRILASRYGLFALDTICRERPTVLVLPHSGRFAPVATTTRLLQSRGRKQLFWGAGLARRYGVASECDRRPAEEAVRRLMLSTCDHYLSYTEISTKSLLKRGYDATRITTLNNAVEALAAPEQAMTARRVPLQILFVASLVEDKEPLAAVAIVDRLRLLAPGASLHIVGDGPLRPQCEQAANDREWVHYHGPKRGQDLRGLALASDIAIIPGRIGLAVLEMASAGLPMATFAVSHHCAEIAYLTDGINGLFLTGDIDVAAKELGTLLTDRPALERMRNEAISVASKYTIRRMAVNFTDGVTASLS
jgi:SAM-dependent methyltransferase